MSSIANSREAGGLGSVLKNKLVWIGALGYFVDVYDLVLFGVVRKASLLALGVAEADLLRVGAQLLDLQMAGMLAGGFFWGVLGDKIGRLKILYASILMYSLSNILNAFAFDLTSYGALRFCAGFGLAGEMGVAITLVAEVLPQAVRGYGSTIVGFAGFLGAISAALLSMKLSWQGSYLTGGGLGIALLLARLSAADSSMFAHAKATAAFRGSLSRLFLHKERAWRYVKVVLAGVPIWYVSGILLYFAPELAQEMGVEGAVLTAYAILWGYVGSLLGDIAGGILSQALESRKKAVFVFLGILAFAVPAYFFLPRGRGAEAVYFACFLLGLGNGYWALYVTMTAEEFGTNLRATVATSVPNVVRGATIPLLALFQAGKGAGMTGGASALALGFGALGFAALALFLLEDTFHKDLAFTEE